MRLLFLVSSLPVKKLGGTEIVTLRLCQRLQEQRLLEKGEERAGGHQCFIYTIAQDESERDPAELRTTLQRYDIPPEFVENIIFSSTVNSDKLLSYTRANRNYARELGAVVDRVAPDVVVAMKVQPPGLLCSALPAVLKARNIPFLFMVRGFTDLLNAGAKEGYASRLSLPQRLRNRLFYTRLLPGYVKEASVVVVQTTSQNRTLERLHQRTGALLFNPVDIGTIRKSIHGTGPMGSSPEASHPDSPAGEGKKRFRLVYVGSMIPRKSLDTLLEAVKGLVEDAENHREGKELAEALVLTLVGGGSGKERVKGRLEELGLVDKVVLAGKMSPEELWPFLSTQDVFVFPSLSEGFPNAVLEAMACSLPVISSDFAGVEDVLVSEKNGLIFRRKNVNELKEKIRFMYENTGYRDEVSSFNSEFVEDFSWDNFLEGFGKVLDGLAENSDAGSDASKQEEL